MVWSMMVQANLPISFGGDALLTATYVLNRVPFKTILSIPYELWIGRKPNLSNLRPWGLATYVHIPFLEFGKLSLKGKKWIFIRYSKGYVFLSENTYGTVTEIESRDATFLETDFPSKGHIDRTIGFSKLMI